MRGIFVDGVLGGFGRHPCYVAKLVGKAVFVDGSSVEARGVPTAVDGACPVEASIAGGCVLGFADSDAVDVVGRVSRARLAMGVAGNSALIYCEIQQVFNGFALFDGEAF